MKLTYIAIAIAALIGLSANACEQERDPAIHNACLNHPDEDTCAADDNCEWKERSDGKFVCRQDTGA